MLQTFTNRGSFILTSGGSILGVKFLDPLAGLVVSGMILKAGLGTGYQRYLIRSSLTYQKKKNRSSFIVVPLSLGLNAQ